MQIAYAGAIAFVAAPFVIGAISTAVLDRLWEKHEEKQKEQKDPARKSQRTSRVAQDEAVDKGSRPSQQMPTPEQPVTEVLEDEFMLATPGNIDLSEFRTERESRAERDARTERESRAERDMVAERE